MMATRRLRREVNGHGMIEFGILIGTLALGVVLTLIAIGTQLRDGMSDNPQHRIGEP